MLSKFSTNSQQNIPSEQKGEALIIVPQKSKKEITIGSICWTLCMFNTLKDASKIERKLNSSYRLQHDKIRLKAADRLRPDGPSSGCLIQHRHYLAAVHIKAIRELPNLQNVSCSHSGIVKFCNLESSQMNEFVLLLKWKN